MLRLRITNIFLFRSGRICLSDGYAKMVLTHYISFLPSHPLREVCIVVLKKQDYSGCCMFITESLVVLSVLNFLSWKMMLVLRFTNCNFILGNVMKAFFN